tara:strand:+ start:20034 stop:20333 length:300 start_codon:yes stop_codon:yes gene_type:complete
MSEHNKKCLVMTEKQDDEKLEILAKSLEQDLLATYGPMLSGESLWKSLGYSSADAFRQAASRKKVPIPIFSITHRRGKYALTKEVARWIAMRRLNINES